MALQNKWFKSFGMSMLPILHDQDIVHIIPIATSKIKIDDIVLYHFDQGYITHRVIYTNPKKNWLLTKGDNNLLPDKKVSSSRILGSVDSIHRKGDTIQLNDYYLFQSTYYFEEIKLVKKELDKNDIEHLFLKGLPVHLYYKRTFPKRDFADCDLLFNKKDQDKIHLLLIRLGYKPQSSTESPLHKLTKEDVHSIEYYKIRGNFKVIFDVHFKVGLLETKLGSTEALYSPSLSNNFTKELFKTSISVTVLGEKYNILNHHYLIIYLATHIFHHNFKGYHRYSFLSDVIKKGLPDMVKIFKIADQFKLINYIYPVFLIYNKYYLPKINIKTLKNYQTKRIRKFSERLAKKIDIFADEDLFSSALNRMIYIYVFSDANIIIKNGIFFVFAFKILIFLRPLVWVKIVEFIIKRILFFNYNLFLNKNLKKIINIF